MDDEQDLSGGQRKVPVNIDEHRIEPGSVVDLFALPTRSALAERRPGALKRMLRKRVKRLASLQEKLYAERRRALLLVFQGMDAAGKDSNIKYVTSGVNPQGFLVTNFGPPSSEELRHSWLQRHWEALPGRGSIGIFNRSHYEEVVTLRAQPDLLARRNLPRHQIDESFWQQRFDDIVNFEEHLSSDGTAVIKFFLHISKEEQRRRLRRRLDKPAKYWKFDPSDLRARSLWDDYQHAYAAAIAATSTMAAPWYVIPADSKPAARVLVASIIVATLKAMAPSFPPPIATERELEAARESLQQEAPVEPSLGNDEQEA